MLSQPKSAMAAPQRELENSIQPLNSRLLAQKLTNFCSHLPEEIGSFQWKASGDTLKIQKPPATLIYAYIYPYKKISQSIW